MHQNASTWSILSGEARAAYTLAMSMTDGFDQSKSSSLLTSDPAPLTNQDLANKMTASAVMAADDRVVVVWKSP